MRCCSSAPTMSKRAGPSCSRSSICGRATRPSRSKPTPPAARARRRPTICCGAAGADHILVHCEPSATIHLHRTLSQIRDIGKLPGVVLNPGTPLTLIEHVLHLCGVVLIMTVNPGFGGQKFLPEMLPKIRALKQMCQ